jgi:cell division protein FtsN
MTHSKQGGGTLLGFVLGLVIGLAVALGVAIYVTKVPTPFSNKNQTRSADQDEAESRKNKEWNPNGVLQPKAPASVPAAAEGASASHSSDKVQTETAKGELKPAVTADPSADAKAKAGLTSPAGAAAGADPFQYYVQSGAFRFAPDADTQKAKLAMMGLDAKVSERDQGGRSVFRVRLGPFEDKATAERVRSKLEANNLEGTIVRVQR